MRVAITTWYGGINAGTFFQLYGLYTYLEKKGHHVEVIRYESQPSDFFPKGFLYYLFQFKNGFLKKINSIIERKRLNKIIELYKLESELRNNRFQEFYDQIKFTEIICSDEDFERLNERFDIFIVGSDQIWNPTLLNKRYLLDYVHHDKLKVSYGPSVGTSFIFKKALDNYKKYLFDFDYISTREKVLQEALTTILNKPVQHVLDPSMLISKEEYLKIADYPLQIPRKSYLLCYYLPNNKNEEEKIHRYAHKYSLQIVIMAMKSYSYTIKDAIIYASAGPRQFVGLIANAAVVMTSSFHCVLFSILLNRDLFIFERKLAGKSANTSARYVELLDTFRLKHRLIGENEDIDGKHLEKIDYNHVNQVFQTHLNKSVAFLEQFC